MHNANTTVHAAVVTATATIHGQAPVAARLTPPALSKTFRATAVGAALAVTVVTLSALNLLAVEQHAGTTLARAATSVQVVAQAATTRR